MKKGNSIEEYNDAFRKQFKDNWECEVRHCQNWLNGERSYFKVGWLDDCKDEAYVKQKLAYAQKMLDNIDYYVQKHSYSYKKSQPQKDNDLSFICKGDPSFSSIIRVPSLKRKSAWKRFYKMYPQLKGKKIIHGSSVSEYHGLNKSTIKLKKI